MGLRRALRLVSDDAGPAVRTTLAAAAAQAPVRVVQGPGGGRGIRSPFSTNQLQVVPWADILGNAAMLPITRAEAMTVPAVVKGVSLVSSQIGRLPLQTLRGDEVIDSAPWTYRTSADVPPQLRMALTVEDLVLGGWALWTLERGAGTITDALRVDPSCWAFDSEGFVTLGGQRVEQGSVVLFKGPHDGILTTGCSTIRGAKLLEQAWIKAARNPIPALVLQQITDDELEPDEIEGILDSWRDARQDPDGAVAFLPASIEAKALGTLVPDVLVEARNAVAVDIARLIGLPAVSLDAGPLQTSLTYQNTSAVSGLQLPLFGLQPYADAISWRLSMDDVTPRGTRIQLDLSSMLSALASADEPETRD